MNRSGGHSAVVAAIVGAFGGMIGLAAAQEPVTRPDSAGRLVRSFDFNSRLPTPLPIEHWYRGQSAPEQGRERPGFPVWNASRMDQDSPAYEGAGSLMLPTQGGSTSVRLRQGVVPVFAAADYLVTAMIRTQGLSHAGAVLEAWQVDESGREIGHSRVRSPVIRAEEGWTPVGVEIHGRDSAAAFIQIELMLLQPRELAGPSAEPERFKIWTEDFSGAVWFDDVGVHQLPRIELDTPYPGNVVRAPQRPELDVFVRDLAGESLDVEITVTDLWGDPVDAVVSRMDGGRFQETWQPAITRLGWYRSVVRLRDDSGEVVGGSRCDFLWLGPDQDPSRAGFADATGIAFGPSRGRDGFGIALSHLTDELIEALPQLTRAAGVGAVKLSVWDLRGDAEAQRDRINKLAPPIEQLLARGLDLTLAFSRIPDPLAADAALDPLQPVLIFAQPAELWHGYADPFLDRYGQRVRLWQLGRDGDEALGMHASDHFDIARSELARLVPGPIVTIPWRSDQQLPRGLVAPATRLSLHMVGGADERAMQMLASEWHDLADSLAADPQSPLAADSPPELELTFTPMPHVPFGHAASVSDLIKRAVLAEEYFGGSAATGHATRAVLTLLDPATHSGKMREPVSPSPHLGAWGQLVDRLADRQITGHIELARGVRGFVLEPSPGVSEQRGGALIVWSQNPEAETSTLEMYLGSGDVRVIDLFGNESPAPRSPATDRHQRAHRIEVTSDPVYIEGVDTGLIKLLTSVRLDPALVEAKNTVHEHELIIDNPWATPVRGKAFVLEPGGYSVPGGDLDRRWDISPRVIEFTIPANGQARIPLIIELSAGTPAGLKPLVLDLEIRAGRDYGMVRVERSIELGLSDLSMHVYPRVGGPDSANDVFLEVEVTNNSDRSMNLELASAVPGFPRGKATISGIKPGETILRTFSLPRAIDRARGVQAAVSLTESGGLSGIRLIKAVSIE